MNADKLIARVREVLADAWPEDGVGIDVVAADAIRAALDDGNGPSAAQPLEWWCCCGHERFMHRFSAGPCTDGDAGADCECATYRQYVCDCGETQDCISFSGDEGPIVDLGRMPVRWRCDECGQLEEPAMVDPEAPQKIIEDSGYRLSMHQLGAGQCGPAIVRTM